MKPCPALVYPSGTIEYFDAKAGLHKQASLGQCRVDDQTIYFEESSSVGLDQERKFRAAVAKPLPD